MKKSFTLPIKVYYKNTLGKILLIALILFLWLMAPLFLEKFITWYGNWVSHVYVLLLIASIIQLFRLNKNVMKKGPEIIIRQEYLDLLYTKEYCKIPFAKIKDIQLKTPYGQNKTCYLILTVIDDKNPYEELKLNYSLDFGLMVIQGQSIDAFITFDMIWQALHNYRHQSNEAIRIRKKASGNGWKNR